MPVLISGWGEKLLKRNKYQDHYSRQYGINMTKKKSGCFITQDSLNLLLYKTFYFTVANYMHYNSIAALSKFLKCFHYLTNTNIFLKFFFTTLQKRNIEG